MLARTLSLLAGLLACGLCACAAIPTGPSVMVLPGTGKSLDEFQRDDATCREWAAQRIGASPSQRANQAAASGAAAGAAVGAAAGAPEGARSELSLQQRYDVAFMQCMYANGDRIPVARSSARGFGSPPRSAGPTASSKDLPPPPPGPPPPPPPDVGG